MGSKYFGATLALLSCLTSVTPGYASEQMIGKPAPEWQVQDWLNSPPLTLRALRGKVVLVRWWTAPDCRYCRSTAPALNDFNRDMRGRGLTVVGFYHHKSTGPLRVDDVKRHARDLQFQFPVAIDVDWRTLRRWWLDSGDRQFTSVSFLIDRRGIIRFIHPGGQYVEGEQAYDQMKSNIEALLAETVLPQR